jgi:glycosyltransferase involved in cell wall biosynthesis
MYLGDFRKGHDEEKAIIVHRDSRHIYQARLLTLKKRPTKILMLTASLSVTGTHRILMDLLEGLDKQKFQILVAYKPEFPGPGDDLVPKIKEMGFKVCPLRGRHIFSWDGLSDLYHIISNNRVDIVHCWDSLSIAARFIGKINGAKIIDSVGNPPMMPESWKNRLAKKVSSIFLDGVIFQSNGSWEAYRKHGANVVRRRKEKVIYNCIDVSNLPKYGPYEKDQIRKKYVLNKKDIILCNLGMYNIQKSQEYLIQAMPEILVQHDNVKLLLVGWGERENILGDHILSLGLQEHVFLTGKKERREVFEILSVTDVYVSSSLWEGLPIAVLEAMAFGIPVVATDVIGNREAFSHNLSGLLVPTQSPVGLRQAILSLIGNPELKKSMGEAGRKRVGSLFTPERFISAHEDFYREILH